MLVSSAFHHPQVALAAQNSQYYCFLPERDNFPIRKTFHIIHELYSAVEWLCKHILRGFVHSQRQRECKAGAGAWRACHFYAAMLRLDYLFDDSQAEAGAAGRART